MARCRKMRQMLLMLFIAANFGLTVYRGSQFMLCEEPEMNLVTMVMVWLKLMDVENQCPTLAVATWEYLQVLLQELLVFGLLALFSKGVAALVGKFRATKAQDDDDDDPHMRNVSYFFFKNAYAFRGEVTVRRYCDADVTTYKLDKRTNEMRRICWWPAGYIKD